MKKKLRILFVWTLVSLLLQFGAYSLLNSQIQKVMQPPKTSAPIIRQLKATIPGSDLKNVQISYAKDYLAYMENGTFKVFNLNTEKLVFEKSSPSPQNKSLGVLTYQWLPDRNTLLYFYAKKNPNPVTSVKVYPPKSTVQTPVQATLPQTEDPNQKVTPQDTPAQPKIVTTYGNPQITELYSLALPDSKDTTNTNPDDRFNQTIDFPAGGKIENLAFSTTTNLIYLTVNNNGTEQLLEIDVMQHVRVLSKTGETIDNMAVSERNGTLFIDSKVGGTQQVLSLNGTNRQVISKNSSDRILGIRDGKVYIGEVKNNQLTKIKTTPDLAPMKNNPVLKTEWEGAIPFKNMSTLIGTNDQVIVYNNQAAYIVTAGKLAEVTLQGDENYVSVDGAELIQLTKEGTSTLAELRPLK